MLRIVTVVDDGDDEQGPTRHHFGCLRSIFESLRNKFLFSSDHHEVTQLTYFLTCYLALAVYLTYISAIFLAFYLVYLRGWSGGQHSDPKKIDVFVVVVVVAGVVAVAVAVAVAVVVVVVAAAAAVLLLLLLLLFGCLVVVCCSCSCSSCSSCSSCC